jgi:hypothetical protein
MQQLLQPALATHLPGNHLQDSTLAHLLLLACVLGYSLLKAFACGCAGHQTHQLMQGAEFG